MNPTPYLIFQDTCREAMNTYANVFSGEVAAMLTAAEMPGFDAPPDKAGWTIHAMVAFESGMLMTSDDLMGDTPAMAGCSVMMELASNQTAKAALDALTYAGTVVMPFGPTDQAQGFGMLTDRFGTSWMISGPGEGP